jgi:hypothetical protein
MWMESRGCSQAGDVLAAAGCRSEMLKTGSRSTGSCNYLTVSTLMPSPMQWDPAFEWRVAMG